MRNGPARLTFGKLCLGGTAAILLAGCATISAPPGRRAELVTTAPAAVVAWTLGDICRQQHPAIDPWPGSRRAPLPIWRGDDGALIIAIGGRADDSLRVAGNGRLAPPRLVLDGSRGVHLAAGRFEDADAFADHGGERVVELRITPADNERTRVRIALDGSPSHGPLMSRLVAALATLDATARASDLLAAGDARGAEHVVTATLEQLRRNGVAGLGELEACLHLQRARLAEGRGDLREARLGVCSAASLRPNDTAILERLARLDDRLARPADAQRTRQLLAARLGDPASGRSASRRLADSARLWRWAPPAEIAAANAVRLLASGDTVGGLNWARSANELGGSVSHVGSLDAQARARGEPRSALAVGLARLERDGFDRELVVTVCLDALATDDPPAALRVLAQWWDELSTSDPTRANEVLQRAEAAAGPALTARVLASTRNPALASRAIRRWLAHAGGSVRTSASLLEGLPALRSQHPQHPTGRSTMDDWQLAPGVAPMR